MKKIFVLILSSLVLFSLQGCSEDKSSGSAGSLSTAASDDSGYDYSGLESQKYAELFTHKDRDSQYSLKWSYDKKYDDTGINYICYDGKSGSYSINLTQPLFNNVKFILKDHKIYDIYDNSKTYITTDAKQSAMEFGYLTIDEFESYAADIFAGLKYLGSGKDKPADESLEYNYDAYYTSKGVELWFLLNDDKSLYAIRAEYDDNETAYMYIEELKESVDEDVFNIPDGYKEDTETTESNQTT
ncbi:MAG: hypothetical protein Q4F95_13820 [Oscillospiraceae bacterium]|nr:hypothetical protein [Oscillospiraceae bacterium]